jgi:hypothetical protein
MDRQAVNSSSIKSAGWADSVLELEFNSGAIYQYQQVPKHIYEKLLASESKGRYFAEFIRACYEYICVTKPAPKENHASDKAPSKKSKKRTKPI